MSTWALVTPDGEVAIDSDLAWSEQIDMTVKDQDGNTIDMTDATYEVTVPEISGVVLTYDSGSQTVSLSLTAEQLDAYTGAQFHYYLRETTVIGAALVYRVIKVTRPV